MTRLLYLLILMLFVSCAHRYNHTSLYKQDKNIPIYVNNHVKKWLHYFQNNGKEQMQIYLKRSKKYIPMMQTVFRKYGLPNNLVYLALIESGFSPHARSNAGAVGYWQFIRGTGIRYNLKINTYIDERKDPYLSTVAAAKYLKSLYSLFGNWNLAIASYNVGENRIKNIVMRKFNRSYWDILHSLPRETQNYVPKFMAAVLISKNPTSYGFDNIEYRNQEIQRIYTKTPVDLKKIARYLKLSYSEIKQLNTHYKLNIVPATNHRSQLINLPANIEFTADRLIRFSILSKNKLKILRKRTRTKRVHIAKRGESLYTIARRYNTSIRRLTRFNRINRKRIIRIGQKIKIPSFNRYKVKKGDTIYKISRKLRISQRKLAVANNLRRGRIYIGQLLKLPE